MPPPENFAAMILTHGRPDRVHTLKSLRKHGYTGRVVIVIDNEDKTAPEYRRLYGDMVQEFDKPAMAKRIDEGDNFGDRRAIIYARNAAFDIAERIGVQHFVQLDDDYVRFKHMRDGSGNYCDKGAHDLDSVFCAVLSYFRSIPALSVALAQSSDFPGGPACSTWHIVKRKAMNSFFCSTDRRFEFSGRINEDVNTYTALASRGGLFMTLQDVALLQKQTQTNAGGMSDLYADSGTYIKSFYSVMYHPSGVRVGINVATHRLHHQLRWRRIAPLILDESHRKPRAGA